MEATSERQRMVHPRKVHPGDPGLIPVFDRSGKASLGHVLESAVRVELDRRWADIRYVRTREGFQVDFLARWAEGGEAPIQVVADLGEGGTREREVRALLAAAKAHPRARRLVVTLTPESAGGISEEIEVHDTATCLLAPSPDPGR